MAKWLRLLLSITLSVLSLGAVTGGTALAGDLDPCSTTTEPFVVTVDAPTPVQLKYGSTMDIKVIVSNCTTADWSGNVRLELKAWADADWCVPDPVFAAQAITLRAGRTDTLSLRGNQPECTGNYTATGTLSDSVDRAVGTDIFGLYVKVSKPGP